MKFMELKADGFTPAQVAEIRQRLATDPRFRSAVIKSADVGGMGLVDDWLMGSVPGFPWVKFVSEREVGQTGKYIIRICVLLQAHLGNVVFFVPNEQITSRIMDARCPRTVLDAVYELLDVAPREETLTSVQVS